MVQRAVSVGPLGGADQVGPRAGGRDAVGQAVQDFTLSMRLVGDVTAQADPGGEVSAHRPRLAAQQVVSLVRHDRGGRLSGAYGHRAPMGVALAGPSGRDRTCTGAAVPAAGRDAAVLSDDRRAEDVTGPGLQKAVEHVVDPPLVDHGLLGRTPRGSGELPLLSRCCPPGLQLAADDRADRLGRDGDLLNGHGTPSSACSSHRSTSSIYPAPRSILPSHTALDGNRVSNRDDAK